MLLKVTEPAQCPPSPTFPVTVATRTPWDLSSHVSHNKQCHEKPLSEPHRPKVKRRHEVPPPVKGKKASQGGCFYLEHRPPFKRLDSFTCAEEQLPGLMLQMIVSLKKPRESTLPQVPRASEPPPRWRGPLGAPPAAASSTRSPLRWVLPSARPATCLMSHEWQEKAEQSDSSSPEGGLALSRPGLCRTSGASQCPQLDLLSRCICQSLVTDWCLAMAERNLLLQLMKMAQT